MKCHLCWGTFTAHKHAHTLKLVLTLSLSQSLHVCTLPLYLNVDLILIPKTCGEVVLHKTMLGFCMHVYVFVCMVLQRVCGLSMYHVVYHMFKITSCRGQVSRQGIEYL